MRSTIRNSVNRGLRPIVLAISAVGGLLLGAAPASAGTIEGNFCMDTLYSAANAGKTTHCASEDVRLAGVQNVSPSSCIEGTTFDLTATYQIVTGAVQRYDIGIYFDINGDPEGDGALTGTCALTTLPTSPLPFQNFDGDFCGDSTSAPPSPLLFTFTMTDVLCSDPDGNGSLDLPFATAWGNSAGPVCADETGAFPQSSPKCKTGIQSFPVEVEQPTGAVSKTATAVVTYSIVVSNTSATRTVDLTVLDDDVYNDITTTGHDGIFETTCTTDVATDPDSTIPPGGTYSCTFKVLFDSANPGSSTAVTDTVTAEGLDQGNQQFTEQGSVTVTVQVPGP